MATNPHISLVFVNYQSAWHLSLALKKLFSLERERDFFEVIVVNNDEGEQKVLERLADQFSFRLLPMESNLGFGRAANRGAGEAQGRILGFLNPDTEWQRKSLREITASFEERAQEQILGLRLVDEHGKREMWSGGAAPDLLQLLKNNIFPFLADTEHVRNVSLDWVSGAGFFIGKETFQSLHGFDEDFFLYFEDVDLCVRAKERGVIIVSEPRFTLLHRGGKSFSSASAQKKYFYTSQLRYFEKHRPPFEAACIRLFRSLFYDR